MISFYFFYCNMLITAILLVIWVCVFEFVNGFHDTANAVATVIYTKTLQPKTAVIYSAIMNFLGILVSTSIWYSVAYKIYNLFPRSSIGTHATNLGIVMIGSALFMSLIRNIGTWRFKIPSSSTHALIATLAWASAAFFHIQGTESSLFTAEFIHIILALIISPVIGALFGFFLHQFSKLVIHDKSVFHSPHKNHEEKWLSHLLIFTCGFVSFNHGSNDGQKGIGMIIIALVLTWFMNIQNFYVPLWAIILIPTILSIGTMIGRERIVETVGKKIWTHEMTYAQWACAELVAASTIGMASLAGLPVSTTHILSSAVLGTMITKDKKSINRVTIRHIALAWVLTIPVCMLWTFWLVELCYYLFY